MDIFLFRILSTFSATIMNSVYGIKIKESNDPYISTAEGCLQGLAEAGVAGAFLVDMLPSLKHIPSWMPGAGFQRKAANWRKSNQNLVVKPFNNVKERIVSVLLACFKLKKYYTQIDSLGGRKGPRLCRNENVGICCR